MTELEDLERIRNEASLHTVRIQQALAALYALPSSYRALAHLLLPYDEADHCDDCLASIDEIDGMLTTMSQKAADAESLLIAIGESLSEFDADLRENDLLNNDRAEDVAKTNHAIEMLPMPSTKKH